MKKLINLKRVLYFFSIIIGIILLQSCVVYQPYSSQQQVTVPDIVKMSKDGYSSKSIIKEIRKSHTYYTLKADQLSKLRNEGVQDSVINYMEKTHIDAIRRNQQMNDSYYGWPGDYGWYGGFGYGWPYGGWGWGPTIIYSGHGGFRGGDRDDFGGGRSFHGGKGR